MKRTPSFLIAALLLFNVTALPAQAATWSVTLKASATSVPVGTPVTFTATASDEVSKLNYGGLEVHRGTGVNSGASDGVCDANKGTTCSGTWTQKSPATVQFIAQVWSYGAGSVLARSAIVTVTWTAVPTPVPTARPTATPVVAIEPPAELPLVPVAEPTPSTQSVGSPCEDGDLDCVQALNQQLRDQLQQRLAKTDGAAAALRLFFRDGRLSAGLDPFTIQAALDLLASGQPSADVLRQVHDLFAERADKNVVLKELYQSWQGGAFNLGRLDQIVAAADYRDATAWEALRQAEEWLNKGDETEARIRSTLYLMAHQNEWTAARVLDLVASPEESSGRDDPYYGLDQAEKTYKLGRSLIDQLGRLGIKGASDAAKDLWWTDHAVDLTRQLQSVVTDASTESSAEPEKVLDNMKSALEQLAAAGVEGAEAAASRLGIILNAYQAAQAAVTEAQEQAMNSRYQAAYDAYIGTRGQSINQIKATRDQARKDADRLSDQQIGLSLQMEQLRQEYGLQGVTETDACRNYVPCAQQLPALENQLNALQKQSMELATQRRPLLLLANLLDQRWGPS